MSSITIHNLGPQFPPQSTLPPFLNNIVTTLSPINRWKPTATPITATTSTTSSSIPKVTWKPFTNTTTSTPTTTTIMMTLTPEAQFMRRGDRWGSQYFSAVADDIDKMQDSKGVKEEVVVRLDRPFDSLAAAALLGVGPIVIDDEQLQSMGREKAEDEGSEGSALDDYDPDLDVDSNTKSASA